jgi:hypothetical protein
MRGGLDRNRRALELHRPLVAALPPEGPPPDSCNSAFTCGGGCNDPANECITVLVPGGDKQCACIPRSLCAGIAKCVIDVACDPDGPASCPSGYQCAAIGQCVGGTCDSSCSCPAPATCVGGSVPELEQHPRRVTISVWRRGDRRPRLTPR